MVVDEHFGKQSVNIILWSLTAENKIVLIIPMSAIALTKVRTYCEVVS